MTQDASAARGLRRCPECGGYALHREECRTRPKLMGEGISAASGRGKDDIDVVTGRRAGLDEGESGIHIAATDRLPCSGCGYMIRGGTMCGDCREYGPPQGWRWEYDPETGKHKQVGSFITPPQMP